MDKSSDGKPLKTQARDGRKKPKYRKSKKEFYRGSLKAESFTTPAVAVILVLFENLY